MPEIDYRKYSSISAQDIQIVLNGIILGNVQGITYSESRQKVPIYTFGSTDPRQFLRGNRQITGTLRGVVLIPDSFILAVVKQISDFMAGKQTAGITVFPRDKYLYADREQLIAKYLAIANKYGLNTSGTYLRPEQLNTDKITIEYDRTVPLFLDELPPVDLLVQGENEYGKKAIKWIYGVEFTDEGKFVDMTGTTQILESANFVARTSTPWREVED